MSPKSRCSSEAASRRLPVACLLFFVTIAGFLYAQPADNPLSDLDGAQVASGWGPMRPTAMSTRPIRGPRQVFRAVYLNQVPPEEARALYSLRAVPSQSRGDVGGESYAEFRRAQGVPFKLNADAWRLGPHPLLDSILGGVKLYLVQRRAGWMMAAAYNGRLYDVPDQLGVLLRDCGTGLRASDIPNWARVFVLLELAFRAVYGVKSYAELQLPPSDSHDLSLRDQFIYREILPGNAPVIPHLAFLSIDTVDITRPDCIPRTFYAPVEGTDSWTTTVDTLWSVREKKVIVTYEADGVRDTWSIRVEDFLDTETPGSPILIVPTSPLWGRDIDWSGIEVDGVPILTWPETWSGRDSPPFPPRDLTPPRPGLQCPRWHWKTVLP